MFNFKKKPKQKEKDSENKEEQVELDEKGYMDIKVPGVVCTNFDETVMHLIHARNMDPGDIQVLVGLDDGQGFNKIAFTLIEKEKDEKQGRSRRSDGLFPKIFKSSGVKKLFLAAVVPGVPENHFNQRALLEALGMEG